MKKLIAILLSITCLLGVLPVFATEAETDIAAPEDVLIIATNSFYFYAELLDGYFSEGESPSADSIVSFLHWDVETVFEDYFVPGEDDYFKTFNVPAEEFEALVFSYFTESEAITNTLRASSYYVADGDYYEIVTGGGFGDMMPDFVYYGYEKQEDGSYIAYATLLESYVYDDTIGDYTEYVPGESDVEGVDYIYMPGSWLANEDDWMSDSMENIEVNHGNVPVKLAGYIKAVMIVDEENIFATMSSFEKIEGPGLPDSESIVLYESSEEEELFIDAINALIYGVYVNVDENSFDKKTIVTSVNITEGDKYNTAVTALEGSVEDLAVYDISASLDGEAVQPKAPVKVVFSIPEHFNGELALYYVSDDGMTETVECTTDYTYGIATAYLTHLSTYALADVSPYVPGDVNGDGTVDTKDMTRLMKYLAGEDVYAQVTDVNGDESTDTKDLTRLMKYLSGQNVDIF